MCQGQQDSAALGYSPMPINLVTASFAQIAKIPGADVQTINVQSCNNPTFTPSGFNLLAETAPYPPACDKQGPIQCTSGTGGATAATPVTAGAAEQKAGLAGAGSTALAGTTGAASTAAAAAKVTVRCPKLPNHYCPSATTTTLAPEANTLTLAVLSGWGSTQTLIVVAVVLLLAVILIPGLISRRAKRRKTP